MICSSSGGCGGGYDYNFQFPWKISFPMSSSLHTNKRVDSMPSNGGPQEEDDTDPRAGEEIETDALYLHSVSLDGSFGDVEEERGTTERDAIYFHGLLKNKQNRYQWSEDFSIRRSLRISTIQEEYMGEGSPKDYSDATAHPKPKRQSVLRDSGNDIDVVFPQIILSPSRAGNKTT